MSATGLQLLPSNSTGISRFLRAVSADSRFIRGGLRPNCLIYVDCIINTKWLLPPPTPHYPSRSITVQIWLKVPRLTEKKKVLQAMNSRLVVPPPTPEPTPTSPPAGDGCFPSLSLTPQIRRDSDQTAWFTFNSDYVNTRLLSQTKHGLDAKDTPTSCPHPLYCYSNDRTNTQLVSAHTAADLRRWWALMCFPLQTPIASLYLFF